MTENLTLVLVLVLHELLVIVFQRVGHHEVHGLVHLHEIGIIVVVCMLLNLVFLLGIFDAELRSLLLVLRLLLLAFLAILLSHAVFDFL